MDNIEYNEYISNSPLWQQKRVQRLTIDEHHCQMCDSRDDLEVHHISYARLGHEEMDDLVTLCGRCHGLVSEYAEAIKKICYDQIYAIREQMRDAVAEITALFVKSNPNQNLTNKESWNVFTQAYAPMVEKSVLGSSKRDWDLCDAIFEGDMRTLFFNKQKCDEKIVEWRDSEINRLRLEGSSKSEIIQLFALSENQYNSALRRYRERKS